MLCCLVDKQCSAPLVPDWRNEHAYIYRQRITMRQKHVIDKLQCDCLEDFVTSKTDDNRSYMQGTGEKKSKHVPQSHAACLSTRSWIV